jgi:hypothetical protein
VHGTVHGKKYYSGLGNHFTFPNEGTDPDVYPQQLVVDYVRVYEAR